MTVSTELNGRQFRRKSSNFTRPSDTTAYAVGDLIANSVTAASVTPLSWATTGSRPFYIPRIRLQKTGTSVTNASFRIHVYDSSPSVATTGDNGVFASVVTGNTKWLGAFDGTMLTAHADGCVVDCVPPTDFLRRTFIGDPGTLYGLIEAFAAYTPANAEVFTATMYFEFDQ